MTFYFVLQPALCCMSWSTVSIFAAVGCCPDAFMGDDSPADDPDHIVLRDHNGTLTVGELYDASQRWYEAQVHDNDAVAGASENASQPHRALLGAWPTIRDFLIVAVGTWMNSGSLVIYSDETNRNDGRYSDIAETEKAATSDYPQ